MRRLILFGIVIFCLLVGATSATAAGRTFHFTFAGKGAQASWTTCPSQPPANVVCTDTFVSVAELLVNEDGTTFGSTTLFLLQFSYKFDRKGDLVLVSERFGFGETALSINNNLTSASASATVPLTTCTADRRGNLTCVDGGTATVSGAWTGAGDLVRVNDNFHVVSKGLTFNSRFQGRFREALATGQVNGSDVGTQRFAQMFDVTDGSVTVCHGDC